MNPIIPVLFIIWVGSKLISGNKKKRPLISPDARTTHAAPTAHRGTFYAAPHGSTKMHAPTVRRNGLSMGESVKDQKGCYGGSLPHDVYELHEGESTLYDAASTASNSSPSARPESIRRPPIFNPKSVREGIILAEILGKPKALRGRGRS